jgi:hypothetical protein
VTSLLYQAPKLSHNFLQTSINHTLLSPSWSFSAALKLSPARTSSTNTRSTRRRRRAYKRSRQPVNPADLDLHVDDQILHHARSIATRIANIEASHLLETTTLLNHAPHFDQSQVARNHNHNQYLQQQLYQLHTITLLHPKRNTLRC